MPARTLQAWSRGSRSSSSSVHTRNTGAEAIRKHSTMYFDASQQHVKRPIAEAGFFRVLDAFTLECLGSKPIPVGRASAWHACCSASFTCAAHHRFLVLIVTPR